MMKIIYSLLLIFLFIPADAQVKNMEELQQTYDKIKEAGIRHPEFVMAQSIQETGWLKCKRCCLRYHNLFGFYLRSGCKKFKSREESIEYYKKWQDARYPRWRAKYPKGTYYDFLKYVKYATGDKYNRELKPKVAWVKKNLIL